MERTARVERKTKETDINVKLNLDGEGLSSINTDIPFLNHMFTLLAAHGFFDLDISAEGDTDIDFHHTVEDMGICMGQALSQALGNKEGIRRYGAATVPMDEALARVIIDISGRPYLGYRVSVNNTMTGNFDISLLQEFFRAFTVNAGITMHIDLLFGEEPHHVAEAIFKAFGRALDMASAFEERLGKGIPSTKGVL